MELSLEELTDDERTKIATRLRDVSRQKIYSTIGVYANGDRRYNGVDPEHLDYHIMYNILNRPGRAFFVQGICVNQGYLSTEQIASLEKEFATDPHKPEKPTIPYQ